MSVIGTHEPDSSASRRIALRAQSVTVDYPGVRALDRVTLDFRRNEIHAIIGENGAGKSTLMQVLCGSLAPTHGTVVRNGVTMRFARPSDAMRAGIAMVHQELNLVETLNVAENISLGREPTRFGGVVIDRQRQLARARELLAAFGAEIDPAAQTGDLSIAQAQFVEIAKCIASEAEVLILDEPTAVLGARESARLLTLLRQLRDAGRAILFITHHLDEVVAVADRISVLRDGLLVTSFERDASGVLRGHNALPVDEIALARAMVGRELGSIYPIKGSSSTPDPAIELVNFGARGRSREINVSVAPGEIVGIAGLVGSGRTESAEAIVGLREREGVVRIAGRAVRFSGVRAAMREGVVYVSEDRKGRGLHTTLSTSVNMTLPTLDAATRFAGLWLDESHERGVTARWIHALVIRCARPEHAINSLSGGNQQKVALARWLETKPRVLIIDEPTRGVDVGAKAEIYAIIARLAREGLACLVISSELPELIGIAHRVVVLRNGTVAGELSREQLLETDCEEQIMRLASGVFETAGCSR